MIARRALILPRVQGADFLAQSCREGQTWPGGACKADGIVAVPLVWDKTWEIGGVQHLPLALGTRVGGSTASVSYGP